MKHHLLTLMTFLGMMTACNFNPQPETMETYTPAQLEERYDEVKEAFAVMSPRVIRPASGYLQYPYLIPAGFYSQMWDWDGFFMGTYFSNKNHPEYLQYWAMNLLNGIDENGYVAGCATTKGPRKIFGDFSMKPFLAQGVWISAKKQNNFEWVEKYYEDIKKTVAYREKTQQDSLTGLFFWQNAMQSGADNNVALNYFMQDTRSFLACDVSTLQMREYKALSKIAQQLGKEEEARVFQQKADAVKRAINQYLWCEADQIYYNVDRETGDFYKRVSYSNFWPLFEKIAPKKNGNAMIEKYLLAENHMRSPHGLRTLSAQDPDYNNKNIIVPFSNWQGPIWPIANYIYSICLKQYGYDQAVEWVAMKVTDMLMKDYHQIGTMHENYHAEEGTPLAPSDDYKDKEGKTIGFISWNLCFESLLEGIVTDNWDLLEIK